MEALPGADRELQCWTLIGELLVHSRDLAPAAVGLLPAEPSSCARTAAIACRGLLVQYRQLGTVGPSRVPRAGSSELDRLAALYGRASLR